MPQSLSRRRALAFLDKYEPKGREETEDRPKAGEEPKALVRPSKQEILPPQPQPIARLLPEVLAATPIDVAPIEGSLQAMLKLLDLNGREGWRDAMFDRPDHRIEKKTERAQALAAYRAGLTAIIAECRRSIEEVNGLNRALFQRHLDALKLAAEALEVRERLNYAVAAVARQDAVAEAKAKAEIAAYAAIAEKGRLSALPPAPKPQPVDEATRKREEARRRVQEQIDTRLDEQAAWSAASEESVARAKARCIEIYQDLRMSDGEKRTRILRVLDEFKLDCSILPPAIEDLMTRAYEEVQE